MALVWPARSLDSRTPSLSHQVLHIWAVAIGPVSAHARQLGAMLDGRERRRAREFKASVHSRRFVASHALLRALLAHYLQCDAAEVEYEYSALGKPALSSGLRSPLRFNIAHSNDVLLIVIANGSEVGIDVERATEMPELDAIARSHFSDAERSALRDRATPAARRSLFYRVWVRKEAYLKARGTGLAAPLDAIDVLSKAERGIGPIPVGDENVRGERWSVLDLAAPMPGYVAAVAAPTNRWRLELARWENPTDAIRTVAPRPDDPM